ncbi:MAG: hypothetical protein ABSC53_07895 [Bacteroidota bacterium]
MVKKTRKGTVITIRPFGHFVEMLEIKIPISSIAVTRTILGLLTLLPLLTPLFLDYSSFFPAHLKMEVFYDEQGIRDSFTQFEDDEIKSLNIPNNYATYQEEYYKDLDSEVKRMLNIPIFFDSKEGSIHSSGQTSFIVEKVDGIQKYYVSESSGELLHTLELPNQPLKQFKTFFEKLSTKDDYLNPSLWHIFTKHTIVLRTQFKQILAQNIKSEGVVFHHSVVSITKVTIFPWPDFSNTIYLANFHNAGLVPIAYAIYR